MGIPSRSQSEAIRNWWYWMNNHWYIKSIVPGTAEMRVSWVEDGKPRSQIFPNAEAAEKWVENQMKGKE